MLRAQQENSSKLKPAFLLTPNKQTEQILIFFTYSDKSFWLKEMKKDWEEIIITKKDAYRSCFTQYYSNKEGYEKISHSSFEKSKNLLNDSYRLDQIPLSKEKLIEIGISNKIELDFSTVPETIADTKRLEKKEDRSKKLPSFLKKDLVSFFDELSNSPEQEISSGSEEKKHCTS